MSRPLFMFNTPERVRRCVEVFPLLVLRASHKMETDRFPSRVRTALLEAPERPDSMMAAIASLKAVSGKDVQLGDFVVTRRGKVVGAVTGPRLRSKDRVSRASKATAMRHEHQRIARELGALISRPAPTAGPRTQPPEPPKPRDFFKDLGLEPSASSAEVKAAHARLTPQYHPDKVDTMGPEIRAIADAKTKEINTARDEIMKLFARRNGTSTR